MVKKVSQHITGWMRRIRFGDTDAISLYEIAELYFLGIIKGTLTTRASSIAFSFFMALFPFLIFVLNLIPFIPVANIEDTFSSFFLSVAPTEAQEFLNSVLYDIQSKPRRGLVSSTFLLSIFFYG